MVRLFMWVVFSGSPNLFFSFFQEMIFVPLDFESRFLGKEIIGVFGFRFGKSLMSFMISIISAVDSKFGVAKQSILSHIICWSWLKTAWSLSNQVPTREEAERAHSRQKK